MVAIEIFTSKKKIYGAPISITSFTMKISHKELVSLLLVSFATYKDKN